MFSQRTAQTILAVPLGVAIFLFGVFPAFAAPPVNDDFDSASVLSPLPFSETLDTSEATTAFDDPFPFCWGPRSRTVWYAMTPGQDMTVRASTEGSNYPTSLSVHTGERGALSQIACSTHQNPIILTMAAGQTYYFMAASLGEEGSDPYPPPGGVHTLVFSVDPIPAPSNDNFAQAKVIPSLPFSDTVDQTGASFEAGESAACAESYNPTGSIWYAFTPETSGSITAFISDFYHSWVAAYTGSSISDLALIDCRGFSDPLTIQAAAGTTYYFQAGGLFASRGQMTFNLIPAPPPVADFFFYPPDPSVYDTVQFYDNSHDPAGIGIATRSWSFGDGNMAGGCCPTHRYATDGDYTVELTVHTHDGRSASTSQPIQVRTHDVAITKFNVPKAASVGQTRQIVVGIRNHAYPETVTVQLFKSTPFGFQFVGGLTQAVPVRSGNRTTDFQFSYTFTSEDGVLGKVTFKAVATLFGSRDALPADNEAIAPPTKIN